MTRDSTATRSKILDAAFEEFTAKGFSGTRVDDIANKAGVNKALLYQYYGDKDALYRNVLRCKMGEIHKEVGSGDPLEIVGRFFDFHASNPWMARLTQWESLSNDERELCDEVSRKKRFAEHVKSLKQAQKDGRIDPCLDAEQTLITLMAIVTYWFLSPQVIRMITSKDPYSPREIAKRRKHVIESARRLLAPTDPKGVPDAIRR
ncbi:MAG: TetR/AcrR family transcriptional regulator [Actinomycetota bacterium]|nr:TetR family transcriptional regulator [Actinomycetota bacterium]